MLTTSATEFRRVQGYGAGNIYQTHAMATCLRIWGQQHISNARHGDLSKDVGLATYNNHTSWPREGTLT